MISEKIIKGYNLIIFFYLFIMINFALIQLSSKHTEIFGTFIEFFLKKNFQFTIYYDLENDNYTFIKYYQKIFNSKFNILPTNKLIQNKNSHHFYIFTSSGDDERIDYTFKSKENENKCIYIHHQAAHWKDYMKWNILVSPVIMLNEYKINILPVYKTYAKIHGNINQTNLAIIGAMRPHEKDKDVSLLIDLLRSYPDENYSIYIFMRRMDWRVISQKHKFLKDNPRIKFFPGLTTEKMIEKLKEVKFFLPLSKKRGWFYWQRLTGTIPLAINLNIPLIMDKELCDIYGMEDCCITYTHRISEVINNVINISNADYYKLIENQVIYKRDQYKLNCEALTEILKDMLKN